MNLTRQRGRHAGRKLICHTYHAAPRRVSPVTHGSDSCIIVVSSCCAPHNATFLRALHMRYARMLRAHRASRGLRPLCWTCTALLPALPHAAAARRMALTHIADTIRCGLLNAVSAVRHWRASEAAQLTYHLVAPHNVALCLPHAVGGRRIGAPRDWRGAHTFVRHSRTCDSAPRLFVGIDAMNRIEVVCPSISTLAAVPAVDADSFPCLLVPGHAAALVPALWPRIFPAHTPAHHLNASTRLAFSPRRFHAARRGLLWTHISAYRLPAPLA